MITINLTDVEALIVRNCIHAHKFDNELDYMIAEEVYNRIGDEVKKTRPKTDCQNCKHGGNHRCDINPEIYGFGYTCDMWENSNREAE